jgi:hypothetical protein
MKNTLSCMILLLLLSIRMAGQVIPSAAEDDLERLTERATSDESVSDALEELVNLAEHPVDLNNATPGELMQIPFLSGKQVARLSEYRQTYGEILTFYELALVQGFDSALVRTIEPYIILLPVSVIPALLPRNLLKFGRQNLILRYEQVLPDSKGYIRSDSALANVNAGYQGTPQRYYFRYSYTWFDKVRIGFAGEKDPGEQFFRGAQNRGMDYYCGFLSIGNLGFLKNLTLGNFRVSYGQGLTFGSGISTGSMPGFSVAAYQSNSILRPSSGARPSLSVSEGDYLRGITGTIKTGPVEISCFVSRHSRDANVIISDSVTEEPSEISSLIDAGYHRTASELADKNAITELIAGGNLSTTFSKGINFGFKIGVTGVYSGWSAALNPEIKAYNAFAFRGRVNHVAGVDWLMRYKSLFFAGEVSRSANGGMALLAMATLTPDSRVNITLVYRNYQPEYQNLFGNAFGQNSNNSNERGLYVATNIALHRKVSVSFFGDFYSFPWLKYRIDRPVEGVETGIMAGWQATRNLNLTIRLYTKSGAINSPSGEANLHTLLDSRLRSYRLSLTWIPDLLFSLRTRLEARETQTGGWPSGFGYLVCQDLQVKPSLFPLSGTIRYALFDIPGYDQRIYIYEPEVLYGYSMPAYSGKGIRVCVVAKWRITRWCEIWARGGITYYSDRKEVGSGLESRDGNTITEVTGQAMFRF